jgi:hypothetical protein
MRPPRPFVLPAKRPSDARLLPAARTIGPADIVIVNGDSVHVCRVDPASGLLPDEASLSLCRDRIADEPTGMGAGLRVTRVGDVLMLRVE